MGHEYSGRVEEVGSNVTGFELGDKVVEEPIHHCGECLQCKRGEENVCANFSITGMHRDGAYADYVVVQENHLHAVPDSVPLREAAITEPTSIATRVVLNQSDLTPGDDVLVEGPGPIGVLTAVVADSVGANVVVSGLNRDVPSRFPTVEQLGIDTLDVETQSLDKEVDKRTEEIGFDLVFDTTGHSAGVETAVDVVRKGGQIVVVGIPREPSEVLMSPVVRGEVDINSSYGSKWIDFEKALQLIENDTIDAETIMDTSFSWQDPEVAFEILERYDVTFFGGPPTMLRMMKTVPNAGERFDVGDLTQIGSGGEALEADTIEWVDETFDGATVQEAYGQTESSMNIGDYAPLKPTKREKIGVEMPGHVVEMVDQETGEHTIDHGDIGEFAVKVADNPGVFKEYWNMPEMTEAKFHDGWLLTEDLGTKDADGYFSFETRADDVIISSGYKIGPAEIEETLAKHESVADSGVIGVPHDERGEVPRAYVTVVPDAEPNPALREELQTFVKDNLAKYEYPREIQVIAELPVGPNGDVLRRELREREGIED